jgi:hypothetical protein
LKGNSELLKKIENALSSNSFYPALAEKGEAYLDALAKARTSGAFKGIDAAYAKAIGVDSFHSAFSKKGDAYLDKLNSAKKKLTMNGDASLFEVAMTNDSFHACISNKNGCDDFINLLGRMITSQAFIDNPQARTNAIRGRPVLRALFKRGEGFLTALVEVQQKSHRNKKAFAAQLGRWDKKYGTTCREFVDGILLRLSTAGQVLQHQQQPPQPPQQQKHQREEKQQQQEHREVQNRFASGAKRKRAEDGEASARIDEAQQLPLAQTVPQQQQQQQQQLVRGNRVQIYGDIPSANENFTGLTPKQINTRRNKLKGEKGEIIEIVNNPGKKHTQYIVKLDNTIRVSGKPLPKTFSVLASNLISLA